MAENILTHSLSSYLKNIKLISFFSIPALVAFLIPALVNTPVFSSLGGSFLRTGSIPDMSGPELGIVLFGLLISLYLVSFAIVNINIVIKSQRTSTNIKNEVMKGVTGYTLNVFSLFLLGTIALLIIQLVTFELGVQAWLAPLLSLMVWFPLLYAPAGLVIDDLRPFRAAHKSFTMVFSKFHYFLAWIAVSAVLLVVSDILAINLLPHKIGSLSVLLLNSLVFMPFLIVLQTHIYMSKYTILD